MSRSLPHTLIAAALMLCAAPSVRAQKDPLVDPELKPLAQGPLTVWIVQPAPSRPTPRTRTAAKGAPRAVAPMVPSAVTTAPVPNEVHEQTAGSFGTSASNVGTNAGDYGQAPSTLGTAASEHGQTASTYGQTAGSFGTAASNHGQTAGSYGQTAGSFGESLSTVAAAGQPKAVPLDPLMQPGGDGSVFSLDRTTAAVSVVHVRADELAADLARARDKPYAPDVLVGYPLPAAWREDGLAQARGVVNMASLQWWSHTDRGAFGVPAPTPTSAEFALLRDAPHPEQARAFAVWMDSGACAECTFHPHAGVEDAAVRAYAGVLAGGEFSPADDDAAHFDEAATSATVLPEPEWFIMTDLRVHVTIARVVERRGLTLVVMRGVMHSPGGLGITHGIALLRPDPRDPKRWRVLSLEPNLSDAQVLQAVLDMSAVPEKPTAVTVRPVSLAAPPDGDNRSPQPELWWDAHPGAELEIVEYQQGTAGSWQAPRLMWIPDHNEYERVRVTAHFADAGSFRWRVWSIGPAGDTVLSAWRTFNVLR